jgi:hypothetical protein
VPAFCLGKAFGKWVAFRQAVFEECPPPAKRQSLANSSGEPLQEKEMTLEAGVRPVGYSCEAVKAQTCGSEVRKMHCNEDAFF